MKTLFASDRELTPLLERWSEDDPAAFDALVPLVYNDLRRRAHACLRQERPGHTLQTTDLVHELYLKMEAGGYVNWSTRGHFLSIAARLMRHILIDYSRTRNAAKRGGGSEVLRTTESIASPAPDAAGIVALDRALARLATLDDRQARIVELRYFAGLTIEDTAAALNISTALVKREWRFARAWLHSELALPNS